jgi:hypothetical protein
VNKGDPVIRRLAVLAAVALGGIVATGGSAHAATTTTPAPTSVRAANGYIACVWEGYVTHLGLCVSMPV